MTIAWFCIPAHGHTNPTLGLVREMTAAGHEIYYFSFEQFREPLEQAGAHVIPCDGYPLGMDDASAERAGKDMAFATELMVSATLALDDMIAAKLGELRPDLIVSDSVAHWGKLSAIKHGIPYVSSTTTFAFNQFSSKYLKQGIGELFQLLTGMPKIKKQLALLQTHGYHVSNILEIVQNDNNTNTIVYTSPMFQPCAETFSERYHFIGPSVRPVTEPMEKTAEKTVYLSLGTVVKNETLYRNAIAALRDTDHQVIVSTGCSDVRFDDLPANIQVYESVDQMAVLSIADVFLTHCGMNSASEGLYFEVPLVLCPQTPEQYAVAKRTAELGAGIMPAAQSPKALRDAIETVLREPQYRESAKKISASFKQCGGLAEARAFLEVCGKK